MVRVKDAERKVDQDSAKEKEKSVKAEEVKIKSTAKRKGKSLKDQESLLKAYERKVKSLEDQLLWLRAEFANYKKRVEREQREMSDYITGEMMKKLLPVLDDFQVMLNNTSGGQNEKGVVEGARMIYDKLLQILEREGLEKIASLGQRFNPEVHEALLMKPIEDEEKHEKVVEVFQEGYKLKEKLLRPSKVVVGKFEKIRRDG